MQGSVKTTPSKTDLDLNNIAIFFHKVSNVFLLAKEEYQTNNSFNKKNDSNELVIYSLIRTLFSTLRIAISIFIEKLTTYRKARLTLIDNITNIQSWRTYGQDKNNSNGNNPVFKS
jgi:hypothetical protein